MTRENLQRPESPCINLCVIEPDTGCCKGCARTLDEIARWSEMSPEEQWDVLRAIRARRGEAETHDA
jgi:predicted Fe-S protein YdhL (DUF1289 family)